MTQPSSPRAPGLTLRYADVLVVVGAVLAVVASFLHWLAAPASQGVRGGAQDVWHGETLPHLFLVVFACVAAAVVSVLYAIREDRGRGTRLGVSWSGLVLVLGSVAALDSLLLLLSPSLYGSGITYRHPGTVLAFIAALLVLAGALAPLLQAAGAGLNATLQLGGRAKPAASPAAGGDAAPASQAGYPQPGYGAPAYPGGAGYQEPGGPPAQGPPPPSFPNAPEPSQPTGLPEPAAAAVFSPSAPQPGPGAESAAPQPAPATAPALATAPPLATPPAFEPYWAAVTSPLRVEDPADPGRPVADLNPGRWHLVTAAHAQGVVIDLDGRPVLVRDPGALVRG